MSKIIAAYGGGFKPPTKGHFEVVEKALNDSPEIDEFIIYVGGGERDGINQAQSILIWEIYQTYLPMKVKVEPSKAPIGDIIRLGKNNLQDEVYFVIGAREGFEDDMKDIESRTKNIEEKYPNMKIKVITTLDKGISGTNARKASQVSYDDFIKYIPSELSDSEKEEVYNIVKPSIDENGKSSPYGSGYKKLNENASYQKDINLIERLAQLTQHMLDKGMNIEPLPNLEFVNGDSSNARDFLGKTAYYNPNNQTIVLYTEGRHPKDITRSYAHEMIHHIQNLESRLGNITTTNTQEDDHLNNIEAEANLKGTMTFRNWTDTLTENQMPISDKIELKEAIVGEKIVCDNCGWSWKIVDGGDDLFICHKCGHNNSPLNEVKPYKHKHGFNDKLGKDPFGLNQFAREIAEEVINEGRYDKLTNQLSSIVFKKFKGIHDRDDKSDTFELSVGPNDEDILSDQFEFDLIGSVEITDDEYEVDGGANAGFDDEGSEITPLLSVKFRIPKNPNWQKISFDIKDVIRHELEHLTQDGENVRQGKQMGGDQLVRNLIDAGMLSKSQYFKLEKEVDAMLQGLYFKAKKSKQPFKDVINNYLNIFVDQEIITQEEKEDVLNIWRSRGKALSLPVFENEEGMKYKIYSDMDGVLTDFDKSFEKYSGGIPPREFERKFGKDKFWEIIDEKGKVGFWVGMPWMEDGKQYWDYIKDYDTELLSSPSRSSTSRLGKRLWVKNNMPGVKLTLAQAAKKQNYAAPNHILIDDRKSNIDQWRSQGGIGILHTSAADTISQLKKLGL